MGEEEGPIKAEEGIRGPRFEALAGRLSRRGGSTPPEGDLGARRKAQGTAARCRRHGEERGPLSWPAPAARRVIASPGQASRVRPLLRTISTPPFPGLPFSPRLALDRAPLTAPAPPPSSIRCLFFQPLGGFLYPSSTTTRSPRPRPCTAALAAPLASLLSS